MTLTLTQEENEFLRETLKRYLADLDREIARTDSRTFKVDSAFWASPHGSPGAAPEALSPPRPHPQRVPLPDRGPCQLRDRQEGPPLVSSPSVRVQMLDEPYHDLPLMFQRLLKLGVVRPPDFDTEIAQVLQ